MPRRPGRPRKTGTRQPNGQLSRAMQSGAILPETIDRRRDLAVAGTSDDELRSAAFGTAIGLLAARGTITGLQKDAAHQAERVYARWRFMAGAPPRHPSDRGSGPGKDPSDADWQRAKAAFAALERSLARATVLGKATIESIVFDGWMPTIWFTQSGINLGYLKAIAEFKAALDIIAADFGLQAEKTAA